MSSAKSEKFGSRYMRTQPPVKKTKSTEVKTTKAKQGQTSSIGVYKPTTPETSAIYQEFLVFLTEKYGDIPHQTLEEAADEILVVLKDTRKKDTDKKGPVEEMLNQKLENTEFHQLLELSRKITDFTANVFDKSGAEEIDATDMNAGCVSVIIGEDSDDDDNQNYVVREVKTTGQGDDEDEDDDDGVEAGQTTTLKGAEDDEQQETHKHYIEARKIDAYWIQREMGTLTEDEEAEERTKRAETVLRLLSDESKETSEVEKELVLIFQWGQFEFIQLICRNRWKVVYCTKLARAQDEEERRKIEEEMTAKDHLKPLLEELHGGTQKREFAKEAPARSRTTNTETTDPTPAPKTTSYEEDKSRAMLDLESLALPDGGHFQANKSVTLPENSHRIKKPGYEEVVVPSIRTGEGRPEMPITELPQWMRASFDGYKKLNPVQTKMYKTIMEEKEENILLCAPTGAGKTNVAMLAVLSLLEKFRDGDGFDLDAFKIVYVAPMKALVQEAVHNFQVRLQPYGIKVGELTGDRQMTKAQIAETQMIFTTPEKWDIVTRKSGERTYTQLVKLLIIDEVHLLHDERGPVLEAIIARTQRQVEETQQFIRIVGLSATLPNYEDVALFLRASPSKGVFHFDATYRPVPLQQTYIGIKEKKPIKRLGIMNDVCYEKVMQHAGKNQILIFVHSRKDTYKTAKAVRDQAVAKDSIGKFIREDSATREILQAEKENVKNTDLKDLLPYGFAVHHAGLERADRTLVEDLFRDGHVQVLVSTATLAWGVNLPAHTVIIKGTQVYNPEKGRWTELSPLDVMQMMGRAGRPQFDTLGEGIIITSHAELQYYLSLMNQQLPIESHLITKLPDMLNGEIVLGTVQNIREAIDWLGYTYLYVRMLRNPRLYGIATQHILEDKLLEQFRSDLIHTAATVLDKNNLIKYDRRRGTFEVTDLGRVASHYYITYQSVHTYNEHLKPSLTEIEIFRLFALSNEFAQVSVREEERIELQKLLERVPVPVKETMAEPPAKINVLLQAYISNIKLQGFALMADMVYVTQSAARIFRALFEISLRRSWAQLTSRLLDICKMVERRMWLSHNPLRQFKGIPEDVLRKLEKREFSWERFYDLSANDLGDLVKNQKVGKNLYKYIHQLPKLELSAHVQPITRGTLRIELTITPDFQYDAKVHGAAQAFWITCEDVDGEVILHCEQFVLKEVLAKEEHSVFFTVPIQDPLPPQYYVRITSDRWLWSETVLPISFRRLILPEKFPLQTELLDLQPLPLSALRNPQWEKLYKFQHFNPVQTQCFHALYSTDDNVLLAAPTGSGKTACLELALLRLFNSQGSDGKAKAVYVAPHEDICKIRYTQWSEMFPEKRVVRLTGDTGVDVKLLEKGHVIISTPEDWDMMSRRWKKRKNVTLVRLFLIDELHLLGGSKGPVLEIITSRMRYISNELEANKLGNVRIVACAASLANAKDLGEWVGASQTNVYNFKPEVRPVPLELHIQGFDQPGFSSCQLAMVKPVFLAVRNHVQKEQFVLFVPEKRFVYKMAVEMMAYADTVDIEESPFLRVQAKEFQPHLKFIGEELLRSSLNKGIAYLHEGLTEREKTLSLNLFDSGAIQVLISSYQHSWAIDSSVHCVIIMGTQYYDGRENRYVDYNIADVLQMMGRATKTGEAGCGKCIMFCHSSKKEYYKKFLYEPLPVESHLDHFLCDHINAEIVVDTIQSKQDAVDYLTWTFLYRRLKPNPNYYNLLGVTNAHVSDYLSELVENTITSLSAAKCITVDEDDDTLSPQNLGVIAAYYYIQYTTIELFSESLAPRIKHKGLLEILANAAEYSSVVVRHREDRIVEKLSHHVPNKLNDAKFTDPHTKVHVLLQAHFSRMRLPPDLEDDRKKIVEKAIPLVQAIVDVIASSRWLIPALAAMELSQMITQGMWDKDNLLLQLPHINSDVVERAKNSDVHTVYDLTRLSSSERQKALGLDDRQMHDVARVFNRMPFLGVDVSLHRNTVKANKSMKVEVVLTRPPETMEQMSKTFPFFPKEKEEAWWVVIGDTSESKKNTLHTLKRITMTSAKFTVTLEFNAPVTAGHHTLSVYVMSDTYLGCDQELTIDFSVEQE